MIKHAVIRYTALILLTAGANLAERPAFKSFKAANAHPLTSNLSTENPHGHTGWFCRLHSHPRPSR